MIGANVTRFFKTALESENQSPQPGWLPVSIQTVLVRPHTSEAKPTSIAQFFHFVCGVDRGVAWGQEISVQ